MSLQREDDPVTVFMGVPTMYSHLLSFYDDMRSEDQEVARRATQRLRLTVSGSAACPLPIMQRWHALSGARSWTPGSLVMPLVENGGLGDDNAAGHSLLGALNHDVKGCRHGALWDAHMQQMVFLHGPAAGHGKTSA